jgi:hypothetical protein
MEREWSDIRCTRREAEGEEVGRELICVLKKSCSCDARWDFPEVG